MKKVIFSVLAVMFLAMILFSAVTIFRSYSENKNVVLNAGDKLEVKIIPSGTTGYTLIEYTVGTGDKINPLFV